jgi:hypothetical protein
VKVCAIAIDKPLHTRHNMSSDAALAAQHD